MATLRFVLTALALLVVGALAWQFYTSWKDRTRIVGAPTSGTAPVRPYYVTEELGQQQDECFRQTSLYQQ